MAGRYPVSTGIPVRPAAQLVDGAGEGTVLASDVPLSLWGGVDPASGDVIDRHHPLSGENWVGRVLVIPHGRGSCTGSAVLLEAIYASRAPALILLSQPDTIIGLGAIVADEVLQRTLPIAVLDDAAFGMALRAREIQLSADGVLILYGDDDLVAESTCAELPPARSSEKLALSRRDRQRLAGDEGAAPQVAMRIIERMARLQGAAELIDVSRVHIDGCIYTGPAGLAFAQQLADMQGRFVVPTTLNSISVDRRHWQDLGVPESEAQPASRLAEAYVRLGAKPTYTCAPYLLDDVPGLGERIAWAESNAVVYANSVLGARTDKTPDFLDACIALTGRAPLAGYHLDDERRARIVVELPKVDAPDDAFYPLLGYVVGSRVGTRVPVVTGLDGDIGRDALKAFGAAFTTTSSKGMFHIVGVTPEAPTVDAALAGYPPEEYVRLAHSDLAQAWAELNPDPQPEIDLVALGNPHFSCEEMAALAALCAGRHKHHGVDVVVTTNRHVVDKASRAGHLDILDEFGVRVVTDTCWCMLRQPVIAPSTRVIVTNSAKYAHYGPGLLELQVRFASLANCVAAAIEGRIFSGLPVWLNADGD